MAKVIALEINKSSYEFIYHEWATIADFNSSYSWIDERWFQVITSKQFDDDPEKLYQLIYSLTQTPDDAVWLRELTALRLFHLGFSNQPVELSTPIPKELTVADSEDPHYLAWLRENHTIERENRLAKQSRDESREAKRKEREHHPTIEKSTLLNELERLIENSEQSVSASVNRLEFGEAARHHERILVFRALITDVKKGKFNTD